MSRTLAELDDSRPFAQRVLRAQGIALVEQILERMKTASTADLVKLAGNWTSFAMTRRRCRSRRRLWPSGFMCRQWTGLRMPLGGSGQTERR